MDDLRFYVLFNSISVISGRRADDNEFRVLSVLIFRMFTIFTGHTHMGELSLFFHATQHLKRGGYNIGVGRFRILWGPKFRILGGARLRILGGGGGQGGPNSQQAHDVVLTSMRRNDVASTSCAHQVFNKSVPNYYISHRKI